MPKVLAENFKAWLNVQPPNKALHVQGTVEVNTGGWTGSLTKVIPQGFNQKILILDLKLTEPHGNAIQVISQLKVSFVEDPALQDYESVTIRSESGEITIDVEVVR